MRGERRDVVEQPAGLGVLDVEPGQRLQLAAVVAELDDLGLDPDLVAVEVGDDVELVDVEAEVVEPLDALLDPPHLVGGELLLAGELVPQRVVPLARAARRCRAASTSSSSELAGLEVEQLGEDVLGADREVVLPHLVATASSCSSPVSASTRYAAKPPALRRNSTLDSDTSPQKKPARCSRTSSTTSASMSDGRLSAVRPWLNSAAVGQRELQVLG